MMIRRIGRATWNGVPYFVSEGLGSVELSVPEFSGYIPPYYETVDGVNVEKGLFKGEVYSTVESAKNAYNQSIQPHYAVEGFSEVMLSCSNVYQPNPYNTDKHHDMLLNFGEASNFLRWLPASSFHPKLNLSVSFAAQAGNDEYYTVATEKVNHIWYDLMARFFKKASVSFTYPTPVIRHIAGQALRKLSNSVLVDIDTKISQGINPEKHPPLLMDLFVNDVIKDRKFVKQIKTFFNQASESFSRGSIVPTYLYEIVKLDSIDDILIKHNTELADIFTSRLVKREDMPAAFWEKGTVLRVYDTINGEEYDAPDEMKAETRLRAAFHSYSSRFKDASMGLGYIDPFDAYQSKVGRFMIENFDLSSIISMIDVFMVTLREHEEWNRVSEMTLEGRSHTPPGKRVDRIALHPYLLFSQTVYQLMIEEDFYNISLMSEMVDVNAIIDEAIEFAHEFINENGTRTPVQS